MSGAPENISLNILRISSTDDSEQLRRGEQCKKYWDLGCFYHKSYGLIFQKGSLLNINSRHVLSIQKPARNFNPEESFEKLCNSMTYLDKSSIISPMAQK